MISSQPGQNGYETKTHGALDISATTLGSRNGPTANLYPIPPYPPGRHAVGPVLAASSSPPWQIHAKCLVEVMGSCRRITNTTGITFQKGKLARQASLSESSLHIAKQSRCRNIVARRGGSLSAATREAYRERHGGSPAGRSSRSITNNLVRPRHWCDREAGDRGADCNVASEQCSIIVGRSEGGQKLAQANEEDGIACASQPTAYARLVYCKPPCTAREGFSLSNVPCREPSGWTNLPHACSDARRRRLLSFLGGERACLQSCV
jgi:hypothetical protein